MSCKTLAAFSALLASSLPMQAFAVEGKYDGQSCYTVQTQLISHADGYVAGSEAYVGMVPDWQGGPLFKMLSAQCTGSFVNTGDQVDEHGACEYVNAAGDKFFGVYARKGDTAKTEGTWRVVHGTGKFEGMTMEGKYMSIGPFPASGVPNTTVACYHDWGTYSVK
jgi:hypothetical protein